MSKLDVIPRSRADRLDLRQACRTLALWAKCGWPAGQLESQVVALVLGQLPEIATVQTAPIGAEPRNDD